MSSQYTPPGAGPLAQLPVRWRVFANQTVLYTQSVAEQLGLNLTDLSCTGIVSVEGPVTAGRLAELAGLTTGAITGAIDRLERAGYVRRESDPNDRRRVVVVPVTEKLVATVAPAFMPMLAATMQRMSSYSEDQIRLFIELITDITEILREETRRVRVQESAGEPGVRADDSADQQDV